MIIIDILGIMLIAVSLIFGVHAITRPDKIASFLGVYITEEALFDKRNNIYNEHRIDLMNDFLIELETCTTDHQKVSLTQKYWLAVLELDKMFDDFFGLQEIVEKKRNRISWRLIKPFAPMLTECLICMSSFWGTVSIFLYYSNISFHIAGNDVHLITFFLPVMIAGAVEIICMIPKQLIKLGDKVADNY